VLRATLRSLLSRKLRLLLSAMAVVLGVSFVSGALVLTDTLGRVFDDLFVSVNDKTSVEVRGAELFTGDGGTTRQPVPASVLDAVREVDGVAAATGDVSGYAQLVQRDGKAYSTNGPPTLGQNWDPEPRTSPYTLRSGEGPDGPSEVAIDAVTAEKTGYGVGDRVPVLLPEGTQTFTVTGVFGFGESDNLGGASIAAFEPATARALFAQPGELLSVRIAAGDGVSDAELRDRVAAVLPQGALALTGADSAAQQADEIKGFFGFFQTFLLVFAGVALFVGAFLIFNTFTILVAQRQRELALLRALGASRGQVTTSVVVESVLVGALASVLGLALGLAVARGLQALHQQLRRRAALRPARRADPHGARQPGHRAAGDRAGRAAARPARRGRPPGRRHARRGRSRALAATGAPSSAPCSWSSAPRCSRSACRARSRSSASAPWCPSSAWPDCRRSCPARSPASSARRSPVGCRAGSAGSTRCATPGGRPPRPPPS
jgi:ABC-type lipoprotein release transport system permease subunit